MMDFVVAEGDVGSFAHVGRGRRGNVFGLHQHFDAAAFDQRQREVRQPAHLFAQQLMDVNEFVEIGRLL